MFGNNPTATSIAHPGGTCAIPRSPADFSSASLNEPSGTDSREFLAIPSRCYRERIFGPPALKETRRVRSPSRNGIFPKVMTTKRRDEPLPGAYCKTKGMLSNVSLIEARSMRACVRPAVAAVQSRIATRTCDRSRAPFANTSNDGGITARGFSKADDYDFSYEAHRSSRRNPPFSCAPEN